MESAKPVASSENVYLIGSRYHHHASHSGYEGFSRWLGTRLKPPVNFREAAAWKTNRWRWLPRDVVRKIDDLVISATKRPGYSLAALLTEVAAALRMLTHRNVLFHVLYGDTDLWLLGRISRMTRNPLIATFHQPPSGMKILAVDERATENLAAAILVSNSQRTHFQSLLTWERVFVVPHGVDTDFFRPVEKLSEEPVCITVGAHWRDFHTLEQAIHLIWEINPEVRFVAVGTCRYKGDRLDPGLNLHDKRVQLVNGVSDEELRRAYQASRVAVFSFWDATANNSLLEAMGCGLPVVATDVGGVREYLGDEAGILCPPCAPEKLSAGVLRLLDEPSLATRMSQASRKRALGYDFKAVAKQMHQIYSDILRIAPVNNK